MDETASHADLILPDRTFLERWDLSQPEVTAGVVSRVLVGRPDLRRGVERGEGVRHVLAQRPADAPVELAHRLLRGRHVVGHRECEWSAAPSG